MLPSGQSTTALPSTLDPELGKLLTQLGLTRYGKVFDEQAITLAGLVDLTDADFKTMEVLIGHKNQLRKHVNSGNSASGGGRKSPPHTPHKQTAPAPTAVLSPGTKETLKRLEEKVVRMEEKVEKLKPTVTISAGTAAGLVTVLRKNNCLQPDVEPWWTKPDTAKRTDADPWKDVLPQGASEKRVVQPHVTKVIEKLAKVDTQLRMLDTHDKVSFFDRKPDIVICPANYASSLPAAWYIVAIGDVKGRRRSGQDKFDDDEIGKVIFFLQDLLRARPDRTTATGFLTDSYIIQFFRVRIVSKEQLSYEVDVTRPYYLKRPADGTVCGGDWLHSLLQEDPVVLGAPTMELSVDGSIVDIKHYLGEGSSSVVWQGKHKERDVVVKIFRAGHEHDLEAEKHNLDAVKDVASVTKYVASVGGGGGSGSGVLLLSPVGTPFSSHGHEGTILPLAEHFAQLVGIVEAAHKHARLLHRDLSLNNFFLGPDGKVFLNDWAAAVPLGTAHRFFGALNFAADAVFEAYPASIVSQPCHDLEMIVKVMFACVHPAYFDRSFRKLGGDSKRTEFQDAIARWQDVRKMEHWKLLFEAAQHADYTKLRDLIRKHMPSLPADLQQRSTSPAAVHAPAPAPALPVVTLVPAPAPAAASIAKNTPAAVPTAAAAAAVGGGGGGRQRKRRGGGG